MTLSLVSHDHISRITQQGVLTDTSGYFLNVILHSICDNVEKGHLRLQPSVRFFQGVLRNVTSLLHGKARPSSIAHPALSALWYLKKSKECCHPHINIYIKTYGAGILSNFLSACIRRYGPWQSETNINSVVVTYMKQISYYFYIKKCKRVWRGKWATAVIQYKLYSKKRVTP